MPARDAHLRQAQANIDFAKRLLAGPPEPDRTTLQWVITVIFYAGLHCVEARFAPSIHFTSRHRRDDYMAAVYHPDEIASDLLGHDFTVLAKFGGL